MAVHRYVNISLPEAKRLGDLNGIAIDLRACRDYCEKYLQVVASLHQLSEEAKHLECFSVCVFVKYGRCFKSGVRKEIKHQIIANLSPDERDLHQLVMDIRDKYIAHSVNDLETHKVRVWLNPEEQGRKISNVNIESHYLSGPEPQLFKRLMQLIDKFLSWIDGEQRKEEKELIEVVRNKYDLNDLYSRGADLSSKLDYSKVSQARKTP